MFILNVLNKNAYVRTHKDSSHHYVPRLLLSNFKIGEKGLIYEYQRGIKPLPISIRKSAAIPNFYTFRDKHTKEPADFLEDQIFANLIERYSSFIIKRFNKEDFSLTNLEESILSTFVSFQYVRTPKFIDQMKIVLSYLYKGKSVPLEEMVKTDFPLRAFITNEYSIYFEDIYKFTQSRAGYLQGKDLHAMVMKMALDLANKVQVKIFHKNLHIIKAEEPKFFFTSDHPVSIFNVTERRSIWTNFWELDEKVVIFLALSPSIGILYTNGSGPDFIDTREDTYNFVRHISIRNAYKSIFSDRDSEEICKLFK